MTIDTKHMDNNLDIKTIQQFNWNILFRNYLPFWIICFLQKILDQIEIKTYINISVNIQYYLIIYIILDMLLNLLI